MRAVRPWPLWLRMIDVMIIEIIAESMITACDWTSQLKWIPQAIPTAHEIAIPTIGTGDRSSSMASKGNRTLSLSSIRRTFLFTDHFRKSDQYERFR